MNWRQHVVLTVVLGLALVSPVVYAAAQFYKLSETGTGDVDATLTATRQSRLSGLIVTVANTGVIESGAYYRVRLDSLDGSQYDAELHRASHSDGVDDHLWLPAQPFCLKKGDALVVTFPNVGSLSGGAWTVQGYLTLD